MTSLLIIKVGFLRYSCVLWLAIVDLGTKLAATKVRSFEKTMMAHLERELKDKEDHFWLNTIAPEFNTFGGVQENPYVS
jgi:hypothetical protein